MQKSARVIVHTEPWKAVIICVAPPVAIAIVTATNRTPRQNAASVDDERALLASALLAPDSISATRHAGATFRNPRCRAVLRAMRATWRRHGTVDLFLLRDELRRQGTYRLVGGRFLAALVDAIPTPHI
ncbi:MAG: DnaB-like helicase N-terminal domain-containing protein [Thermoanaerobaculia bacterium]